MLASEAGDNEKLKRVILQWYISDETYRQRFGAAKKAEESYRELAARLQDLEQKWMRECSSINDLRELIGREQLVNTLSSNLHV